jgi:hypothetical protein
MLDTYRLSRRAALLALPATTVGCAWQRIPEAPPLTPVATTLPLRVGVVLAEDPASQHYGPQLVPIWKEVRLFDTIFYPYREGDPVDGTMDVMVSGGWTGSAVGAGVLTGLTFGLAGAAVGPSMTGKHDVVVVFRKRGAEVFRLSAGAQSDVEFGMLADANEVAAKTETLHQRRLALAVAQRVEDDRAAIEAALHG